MKFKLKEAKLWDPKNIRNATFANHIFDEFDILINTFKRHEKISGGFIKDTHDLEKEINNYITELSQFRKELVDYNKDK